MSNIFGQVRDKIARLHQASAAAPHPPSLLSSCQLPLGPRPFTYPDLRPCVRAATAKGCTGPGSALTQRATAAAAPAAAPATTKAATVSLSAAPAADFVTPNCRDVQGWIASAALAGLLFPVDAVILNSGSTHHIDARQKIFLRLCSALAEDTGAAFATGASIIRVQLANGIPICFKNALHVPGMAPTLVSLDILSTIISYTTVLRSQQSMLHRQHQPLVNHTVLTSCCFLNI